MTIKNLSQDPGDRWDRACVALEGLSLGDAFGQCFFQGSDADERIAREEPPLPPWNFTDDTQMALSIVESLGRHQRIDPSYLAESFATHYEYERAYGPTMHRLLAEIRQGKPWADVSSQAFGGEGSCGNGSAMRVAPLGAYFADDLERTADEARKSAVVTHSHPEAVAGAIAVALSAAVATRGRCSGRRPDHHAFFEEILPLIPPSEICDKLAQAQDMPRVQSIQFPVAVLGNGLRMTAQDTVPLALWCAAQSLDDFPAALWLTVSAGGDRDTLCAMVGGIVASFVGRAGLPADWLACREPLPKWPFAYVAAPELSG